MATNNTVDSEREWRILVIGNSGVGKSSLCNELVKSDRHDPFRCSQTHFIAETHECQRVRRTVRGRKLTVVDSPGAIHTRRRDVFPVNPMKEIDLAMSFCPEGYHAILLLLRLDLKLTKEEKRAIDLLKKTLGDTFLTYTTIVFTHGDEVQNDDEKFRSHVHKASQDDPLLENLLRQCRNRMVMVDTSRDHDQEVLNQQLENLFNNLNNDGSVYNEKKMMAARRFDEKMPYERDRLNIIVFGDDGVGKSSLANALLEENLFPVRLSGDEEAKDCIVKKKEKFFLGKCTTVIETRFFTNKEEITKIVNDSEIGFHTFLLVLRADGDLVISEKMKQTLQQMRDFFSVNSFNSLLIVAFIHTDTFHNVREFRDTLTGARRNNGSLNDLLNSCQNRFVTIGNSEQLDEETRLDEIDFLRRKINEVAKHGPVAEKVPVVIDNSWPCKMS